MKRRDDLSGKGGKKHFNDTLFLCMAFERVFRHSIGVLFGAMLLYELWFEEREKRGVQNLGDQEKRMHGL
jgi:hypothetical protein